jgi:hypothetical protein
MGEQSTMPKLLTPVNFEAGSIGYAFSESTRNKNLLPLKTDPENP